MIAKRLIPLLFIVLTCFSVGLVYASDVDFSRGDMGAYLTLESGILTLHKWDGEVSLSFGLPIAPNTVIYQNSTYVELQYADNIRAEIYPTSEGLEYMIIFDKKITQLNHHFPVSDAGLTWMYQPPLNEVYSEGYSFGFGEYVYVNETDVWSLTNPSLVHRPLDVVGSYAVYYSKSNNEYKTGKFTHIYRPLLTDSSGDSIYGDLSYANHVLTISADSNWLKSAEYPVYLDPTFGYTSIGASSVYTPGLDWIRFTNQTYTPAVNGTLWKMSLYSRMQDDAGFPNKRIRGIVYDSGFNLIDYTSIEVAPPTAGATWKNITFTNGAKVWTNGSYFVAGHMEIRVRLYYDASALHFYRNVTDIDDPLPDPIVGEDWGTGIYSIFATYNETVGGPTAYNRSLTGSFTFTWDIDRLYTGARSLTQPITFSGNFNRLYTGARSLIQSISFTGDITRVWSNVTHYFRGLSLGLTFISYVSYFGSGGGGVVNGISRGALFLVFVTALIIWIGWVRSRA